MANCFARTPSGYTWHHHQELGIMQLVPSDIHNVIKHIGGVAKSPISPYR
ncbi:HNH endonuclease [Profundibacter sp.]